jgi:hypothetical protein
MFLESPTQWSLCTWLAAPSQNLKTLRHFRLHVSLYTHNFFDGKERTVESIVTPEFLMCIATKCRCGTFTRNGFKSYEAMIHNTINFRLGQRDIQLRGVGWIFSLTIGKILTIHTYDIHTAATVASATNDARLVFAEKLETGLDDGFGQTHIVGRRRLDHLKEERMER